MPELVSVESAECFDEQTVLDLVAGRLSEARLARVEHHLGSCEACTDLLAAATPLLAPQQPTGVTLQQGGAPDDGPPRLREVPARDPDEDQEPATPHRRRASLPAGTVLRDTYQIVRRIGQGGMGDVYEAKHARLTGRYAVKVLPPEFALNVAVLSRFRREAQIASGLQHPNIVQVIDFHETDDGTPYLVMEFLDGEDLAAFMNRRGPISLTDAIPMVEQIGAALSAVHRRGIVHRDVKPQNVFLVPQENGRTLIKLVDFGLSRAHSPSVVVTRQPMLLGTPQYMAPEQALARSDQLGPATDQFALAAIVYQLLSGRPPFVGERVSSVLYQIVHEDPPPLGEGSDPRVEAVLRRALSKPREDRYPSMNEFVEALGATLAPTPDRTATPTPLTSSQQTPAPIIGAPPQVGRGPSPAATPSAARSRRPAALVLSGAVAILAVVAVLAARRLTGDSVSPGAAGAVAAGAGAVGKPAAAPEAPAGAVVRPGSEAIPAAPSEHAPPAIAPGAVTATETAPARAGNGGVTSSGSPAATETPSRRSSPPPTLGRTRANQRSTAHPRGERGPAAADSHKEAGPPPSAPREAPRLFEDL